MSSSDAAEPDIGSGFNSLFLGTLIACGVLSVFFLLYFNRVFASLVSWALRTWTWHRYRVYIDIQAIQISLLAGRVFFTGLRYHGNNETILVQNGHITWAYWLWRVREVDISKKKRAKQNADDNVDASADVVAGEELSTKLPCRVNVTLSGLEWFIYNRSPAYDSILAGLKEVDDLAPDVAPSTGGGEKAPAAAPAQLRRRQSRRYEKSDNVPQGRPSDPSQFWATVQDGVDALQDGLNRRRSASSDSSGSNDSTGHESNAPGEGDGLPLLLQLYPINLQCGKAALVMGNENTKAILIIKTESLSGEIDAAETETPDPYRQFYRFNFKHPVIEMKENQDFKEEQVDRAARDKESAPGSTSMPRRSFLHQQKRRVLGRLRDLIPYWRKSVESLSVNSSRDIGTAASHVPGSSHWQGLSRYLYDDSDDQKARWASSEYAAVTTVLDSPEASLAIFWDVPGRVRHSTGSSREKTPELLANINGEEPPAWAIHLSIKGGSLNYGPWADRQRADLQRTFVPNLCKDAVPATRLPLGAYRVPTQFKLYVELEDTVTLRIPMREASKNWRWKGKEPGLKETRGPAGRKARGRSKKTDMPAPVHQRPYGWLDIKVAANATMSYSMDMVTGASGYSNTLNLDFPSTEISSSINHELLWRSGRQRISCDLSTPLRWNALRQWRFNIISEDLELFLLRDHVFLLIDLVDDWASGPPADYLVFIPFKYHLDLQLHNVRLYLNLNDANIIDNPTDLDDNTYLIIKSPLLQSATCIPIDSYRPKRNAIPFDIRAELGVIDLHMPPWNTQASFLASKEVGRLENLVVDGSYHYNATTSPSNTDTLLLNVAGQSPIVHLYGFVVRYFMKVKDNYFGEDIHFKTLEEYQEILRLKDSNPEAELSNKPPSKKSNDLDVILSIRADDPKVLLPANLYSSQRHVQFDTACLSLDVRFTNYYMDLDLVVAPLNLSLGNTESGAETPIASTSSTQLFVDGLNIYGHRLFGLPPTEPTYLCNWDISTGAVTGECTVEFLTTLMNGANAFAFSFDDDENALISLSSIILYDVTFLRATVQSVRLWLHIEEAAFLISTGSIGAHYNDWARSHYSRRADIKIPGIKLSCVNADSATRHKARSHHPVEIDALVETSLRVAIIGRKFNFSTERKLQQELVRREDQRTMRTPFLLNSSFLEEFVPELVDLPAQSVPPVPSPVNAEDVDNDKTSLNSKGTSRRSKGLRHKNSFLSLASSGTSSILKPYSRRSSVRTRLGDRLHPLSSTEQQAGRNRGSSVHARELSASTRHSAFYSALGDHTERQDVHHNTVAFSSPFFAPYFPLENARPSHKEAMMQSIEEDDTNRDQAPSLNFDLGDVDPDLLSEDCAHSSTLIEFPAGVTAFCNPTSLRHVAALLSALQPTDPDNVLDSLQVDSMKDIFTMQKDQKMKGHIEDLLIRLPRANIRFINTESGSFDPPAGEQDQFDVTITRLALASRSQTKWTDAFKPESKDTRKSFHVRLASIEMSAVERCNDMENPQAAALALVENVMISVGSKGVSYFDVGIGNIQGNASSEKIEYLASLVHRTTTLGSDLGNLFASTSSNEKVMMQTLVQRLVGGGQEAPDPSFLIRPSAVLRSADQHLRTFDSWKLIMRLRQMWAIQHPSDRDRIKFECLGRSPEPQAELIRQEVVAAFEKWRSWDLENLLESVLLNRIFGPPTSTPKSTATSRPTLAVIKLKRFQIALDPGPKQNEVSLLDLTTRLESRPAASGGDTGGGMEAGAPSAVLTLDCGDAALNLNWELCEMAGDILRLIKRIQPPPTPESGSTRASPTPRKSEEQTIHCVLSLGRGSVALEAVNLHASSSGHGIKASLLARTGANNHTDTNLILSCDSVTSGLRSHSQALAKFVLDKPSIFLSDEMQATHTTDSHIIKITASSRYLSLVVKQDPINLAEVLDLVVRDEVAQLYRLKNQLPSSPGPNLASKKIVDRLSAFRVNVAMFMDQYTVSVPLLQSLTYTINGTVSRVAMAANFGKEIILDFDIKENSHEMQIRMNNVARSISLLEIPPTNGRVRSHMDHGEHSIDVFASLELVQLDASAVYSLLSALNRPEISNAISELQRQGKIVREHVRDITGGGATPVAPPAKKEKSGVLAYAVNLTFAGFEIFGNSPLKSEEAPQAHISFALDSIHFGMANRVEQHGPTLTYPEFHANLRHIGFEIQKGSVGDMKSCGNVEFGALITASSRPSENGKEMRFFDVKSDAFEVNLSPDTVSTVVDVLGYMGDKIKDLDTSRELEYLRKLRQSRPRIAINDTEEEEEADIIDTFLSSITYTFEICDIQFAWLVNKQGEEPDSGKEDLILSLERIEFGTRTRNSARLTIENLQLQIVSPLQNKKLRSPNSALLPEVIFNIAYVSTAEARRLAFQAVGKSLDIRLTSGFVVPAANLSDSIGLSVKNARQASQNWNPVVTATPTATREKSQEARQRSILGSRRLESLLIDADFAGAVVHLAGRKASDDLVSATAPRPARSGAPGRSGQLGQEDATNNTALRSPGLACKVEYRDSGKEDPSLYVEVKIDASSNILYPSVVPLIVDISNGVKAVVSSRDKDSNKSPIQPQEIMAKVKTAEEDKILTDPTAVLGRMKLNLGLRVCRQEFSLSCQPIARVAATASFEDVYFTASTVRSMDQGNFFAISGAFTNLQASVQHVYSRESTGSFKVQSIVLSLMNSKHVSGTSGLSAILKVSPMEISANAKQLQDFMLFREIWLPRDVTESATGPAAKLATETSQGRLVQRYQQVAATAAFPWTASISISELKINVDLGQALGKASFAITDFWVSSKKTSDWEQNLCLGFKKVGVESTGRMSGFVALQDFKLRTSIEWPEREQALNETPMIQASVGFSQFRVKAAFDYQAFLVADITSLEFLMYNVRRSRDGSGDRLVAIFDGEAVQVFGTTSSAAQGIALYQAFQRLVQERRANFETSLKEIEKFMKRKSVSAPAAVIQRLSIAKTGSEDDALSKSPISLDTDVVVTLKALNLGVFPSTFSDHQVFKMEALNAQARFAASITDDRRIHSILGLTLGQLRIGLAGVRTAGAPKSLSELSVEDVVQSATGSRGGTILKVPQVEAVMQTWQRPESRHIDYIFKSAFEGKVEVGWNYSRISYIRGMWANHSKSLAQTWGRELPPVTAIRVTGVPESPEQEHQKTLDHVGAAASSSSSSTAAAHGGHKDQRDQKQQKITAEVKVPQSKYEYTALEPAIIETPQLRDMGEATPPLEWIGLHRDRLPNLTHQIVIVSLLELAGEVEDAYSRILGSS
ncbi:hypothetical protein B0T25DRAFT_501751 [Lasiosphaeria hispida]|uniref:Protein CSF1 n=1 Tax=Lasiosphaeria hispida TaxID=260671 RepID=A0AAJ0ME45_9PEZI|nr:hypothetical protein B0T25DRAFT_501751 [Lasiosphaeria hispida]